VAKAITTTSMIDKLCARYGLALTETPVGFKSLGAEMAKGDVLVGVEESGSFGLPSHLPERDGLAGGMMVLEMLAWEGKPLSRLLGGLERELGPHRYARRNLRTAVEAAEGREVLRAHCLEHAPARLRGSPVTEVKTLDGVKYVAKNGSWLMVRGSGTEPVVRVYAEAGTDAGARDLVEAGARLVLECRELQARRAGA
jgi:phosphomannomutase